MQDRERKALKKLVRTLKSLDQEASKEDKSQQFKQAVTVALFESVGLALADGPGQIPETVELTPEQRKAIEMASEYGFHAKLRPPGLIARIRSLLARRKGAS